MPRISNHSLSTAAAVALALLLADGLSNPVAHAHKAVTSKYTYNEDVFPIFRDRCGSCHAAGGATPMSLLTYKEALPWSESVREEVTGERMPPWFVDPMSRSIRGGGTMTAREIDTILTWATGGTPEGSPANRPPSSAFHAGWKLGPPDLTLVMPEPHAVDAALAEELWKIVLPTNLTETKWLRAADLLPGTADMVRDATISIENGPVLATWISGDEAVPAPAGTAFRLPAGAAIQLEIHYKKPWQEAQVVKSDRSAVGLYFAASSESPIEIHQARVAGSLPGAPRGSTIGLLLTAASRVVALTPTLDRPYESLEVHAVTPAGAAVPLLLLRAPRPGWQRRYWLSEGADLPAGSRIEMTAKGMPSASDPAPPVTQKPLDISVHYLSR